jgi:3-oxoacyl-[acyl-carrier-protein] synthase II
VTHPDRAVVVTGIGPITASGIGIEPFWAGLSRGASPIRTVSRFDPGPFRSHLAAEVADFDATRFMEPALARRLDRFGQFSISSARLALDDAGLDPESVNPDRVAVQMGSALGGVSHAERQLESYLQRGVRGVDPRLALTVFAGAASCNIAIHFGFTGPNSTKAKVGERSGKAPPMS